MICPYMSGLNSKGSLVKVDCIKYDCAKYVQINGVHPQTGENLADWRCSDAWMPILLIENSQMSRETGAAVESFRNEVLKAANSALQQARVAKENEKWLESQ